MDRPEYATVLEVLEGKGVKIKLDGPEDEAVDTYYNTCVLVNVGDRVHIRHTSGDILIVGKLLY